MRNISSFIVLKRVLSLLNDTFVSHGVRVAYIAYKIIKYKGYENSHRLKDFIFACILHDIGAYKTEEINDLFNFEVTNTLQHSVYGYLFVKNLTPFCEDAEAILYHHANYNEKEKYSESSVNKGLFLKLCDRVDICVLANKDDEFVIKKLMDTAGTSFNPQDVLDFIAANNKYNIISNLRNQNYEEELKDFIDSFEDTRQEILAFLQMTVFTIDFRSEQTVTHSVSTAVISKYLCKLNNLTEEETNDVYIGALIHDIGKLKTPRDILESNKRLTPDEIKIMREHINETYVIINDIFPKEIVNIAYRHHERLDGSGYPNSLTEKELTTSERIVAIADVLSALLGRRTYKESFTKQTILDILIKEGTENKLDMNLTTQIIEHFENINDYVRDNISDTIKKYEGLKADYLSSLAENQGLENKFTEDFNLFPDYVNMDKPLLSDIEF